MVFRNNYANLQYHQQCTRVSFSLNPYQVSLTFMVLAIAVLTGVR